MSSPSRPPKRPSRDLSLKPPESWILEGFTNQADENVEPGDVMTDITVDVASQQIVAAITRSSAERLGLAQGQPVTVFKATEIILGGYEA
jgi:molybdopterin-binding protein